MTTQTPLYTNAATLNVKAHQDLSIRQSSDLGFARKLGAVPLVAAEFAKAAEDMPIVFAQTDEGLFPWVLMGLNTGQNAFVTEQGTWSGRYIPAFLRRYPFIFSSTPGTDTLTLCIDESHEALNRDGAGERLFDADGNRTRYLEGMLEFATQYQQQFLRTKAFAKRLEGLGLFEPITATFTDAANKTQKITGFSRIKRDALKAVPKDSLQEMFATDELELCFLHLHSLSHIRTLAPVRGAAADAASEPA